MVNDAFRAARCAGGIVQRKAFPFIFGHDPLELWITRRDEIFVVNLLTNACDTGDWVGHFNDAGRWPFHEVYSLHEGWQELTVDQDDLGFAVVKDVGNRVDVETGVDGVEDRATCRHPESGFGLGRNVGQDRRDDVTRVHADFS